MTRIRSCILALAALLFALPAIAADTTRYTLVDSAWTDLGTGPLFVQLQDTRSALVVVAATAPASLAAGAQLLDDKLRSANFGSGSVHVYARAAGGGAWIAASPAAAAGSGAAGTTTTSGALAPPVAAAGKITQTNVAVPATTSTQLVAANANRIAIEIQCDGTAIVGIDRTGGTLTSAAAAPLVMPAGSYPLYIPPIASLTAITAYTGTAQTCRVAEYLR